MTLKKVVRSIKLEYGGENYDCFNLGRKNKVKECSLYETSTSSPLLKLMWTELENICSRKLHNFEFSFQWCLISGSNIIVVLLKNDIHGCSGRLVDFLAFL